MKRRRLAPIGILLLGLVTTAAPGCGARIVGDGDASAGCTAETTVCDGICVDTSSSPSHCGGCGITCAAGESCVAGTCELDCPAGQTPCGGVCVSLASDLAHCGACDNACPGGEVCSAGTCATSCAEGLLLCEGTCRDTLTDRANCGACGLACDAGQVCSDGMCLLSCSGGLTECDGSCRDVQTDRSHCGACGNGCVAGEVCSAGTCQVSCGGDLVVCGETCRDLQADRRHCGACGNACPAGTVCSAGACEVTCGEDLDNCSGSCRDLATDRLNCGACGTTCAAGEVCSAGTCEVSCGSGLTSCSGTCRDLTADRRHCGACGNLCPSGTVCSGSACETSCSAELTDCGGSCRDLSADRAHCGACGNSCSAGEVCSEGACVVSCVAGQTDCGGSCRDLTADRRHCGACGNVCGPGQVCSGSACTTTCGAGLTDCGGSCRDTATDRSHCGACGTTCSAGQVCAAGSCQVSCGSGLVECGGVCRDLATDRNHCGGCGIACDAGEICSGGTCVLSCAAPQVECAGACADLASDRAHCGACGNACGAGRVCSMGACALSCAPGLGNCSGACVDTRFSPDHCTACGTVCGPYANAVASCNAGCIMTCNAGFADCDGSRGTGCESRLAVDASNCGRCGNACSYANAGAVCSAGVCAMGTCHAGFADCDGSPANGCECRVATIGPPGSPPFSGGDLRDLAEDPATGAISPSGMVVDTSRDFLWVVNVNESTVSRWDAATRSEIARYRVGLASGECAGRCCHEPGCNMPSRVVVDGNGDSYVANRGFNMQGTVTKIAGDLADCVDRNGNGMIDTSTSATPLAWGADECVLWTANVGPVDAVLRSITVDAGDAARPNGYVWVGSFNRAEVYRLDPLSGAVLDTIPTGVQAYGMVVTRDARLWVSSLGNQIRPIDTTTRALGSMVTLPFGSVYGISADANGRLWFTLCCWESRVFGYDPATGQTTVVNLRAGTSSGVTVDALGNVWVGQNEGSTRSSWARWPTSAFAAGGAVPAASITYFDGPANPTAATPSAVGVDRSGAVWLASYTGNSRLLRLDPTSGTVSQFLGPNQTYSYSDFTGSVRRASIPQGSFEQTFDLGCASPSLTRFEIDGTFPADTTSTVSMRTSATVAGLSAATPVSIATLPTNASPYALGPIFSGAGVTPARQLRVTLTLRASAAGAVPLVNGIGLVWTCP